MTSLRPLLMPLSLLQMRTALQEGSESEEDKADVSEAVEVKVALYNDCIAAMAFLLDKERGFHRVRHAVARCIVITDFRPNMMKQ